MSESVRLTGIKQGAGKAVTVAFGGRKTKGKKTKQSTGGRANKQCWDAFHPCHLALPRAVAPYTVIRTTAIWAPEKTDANLEFAIFGPSVSTRSGEERWSNTFCQSSNVSLDTRLDGSDGSTPPSFVDSTKRWTFDALQAPSWQAASLVPSAYSIQIMNTESLQNADGIAYIGRCRQKVNLSVMDTSSTYRQLAASLVSYSEPRLCSAGKLALRGVQGDEVPSDMSQLANFRSLRQDTNQTFRVLPSNETDFEGFLPVFIYNPNKIHIQVLVCCEWRVRFDPSNPAYASHILHKPASEHTWFDNMKQAVNDGNGIVDIVEKVANTGMAAANTYRAFMGGG